MLGGSASAAGEMFARGRLGGLRRLESARPAGKIVAAVSSAPFQLSLFDLQLQQAHRLKALPARDEVLFKAEHLAQRLSRELELPVRLSVTDNRSTMVSFRRSPATL